MKKQFFTVIIIFFTFHAFAQKKEVGDLIVSSSNQQNFYFYLDDVVQNNEWANRVDMQDVPKGLHKASFRFKAPNIPPLIATVYVNPNKVSFYQVIPNNVGGYLLQVKTFNDKPRGSERIDNYNAGTSSVQENCSGLNEDDFKNAIDVIKSKPFDDVRLTVAKEISTNNRLSAAQVTRICRLFNFDDSRLEFAKYAYDYCCDKKMYYLVNASFKFTNSTIDLANYIKSLPVPADNIDSHEDKDRVFRDNHEGDYNNQLNHTGCVPMEANVFQQAGQSISAKSFDDTKLELAKSIAENNCLYADQIVTICRYFSFEATKLDFAKYAYSHCYDKSNYFKVSDVFDFESSVKELTDYINNK